MYLWDSNILRHFGDGHPTLRSHLERTPWSEIALPSVVVAEALRGRCEHALKAAPLDLPSAHALLFRTQQLLSRFNVVVFDERSGALLSELRERHRAHKRYADLMIAAMAHTGRHVVVTRNVAHFARLLPRDRIANWIDQE